MKINTSDIGNNLLGLIIDVVLVAIIAALAIPIMGLLISFFDNPRA